MDLGHPNRPQRHHLTHSPPFEEPGSWQSTTCLGRAEFFCMVKTQALPMVSRRVTRSVSLARMECVAPQERQ
jgi:hypothetical protein